MVDGPIREKVYAIACAMSPSVERDRILEACVQSEREEQFRAELALPKLIGVAGVR
jgi:hypothetical protein